MRLRRPRRAVEVALPEIAPLDAQPVLVLGGLDALSDDLLAEGVLAVLHRRDNQDLADHIMTIGTRTAFRRPAAVTTGTAAA